MFAGVLETTREGNDLYHEMIQLRGVVSLKDDQCVGGPSISQCCETLDSLAVSQHIMCTN